MGSVHTMPLPCGQNRIVSDMFLDQDEIDALCDPVKQPAAQFRKLKEMGLRVFMSAGRRKRAQVPRLAYEVWKNPPPPPAPAEPHWVSLIPPRPPWHETPLGRWQQEQREARAQEEAEREALPKPTKAEIRARERAAAERAAEAHAAVVRFHAAKRRCSRLQRTPAWADLDAMRAIYAEARRLTKATGIPHHVDHEIPLQGKLVSGLHVHNNLQILTGSENSKKRNRFEVQP